MLPIDFINRMKLLLKDEYNDFLSSYDKPQLKSLRINSLKCNSDLLTHFKDEDFNKVPWCNTGFYYENIRPGKHPFHEAGAYYIQEPSAMSPAIYLDAKPGDKVLDLCAAPGGKSTQIASSMNGEGLLISNEIIPSRAKILSENIERLGIKNAIITNEAPEKLSKLFINYFDKIMVDAPCSGEGMFRKNSDACNEWNIDNVNLCSLRQEEILNYAAGMLKPGGRMVYSTCTFAPEENELNILKFLKNHTDFHIVKPNLFEGMNYGNPKFLDICDFNKLRADNLISEISNDASILDNLKNTIRLWPHKLNGEGHFIAILEKSKINDSINYDTYPQKIIKGVSEKSIKTFFDFSNSFLKETPKGIYVTFGNQLNLLPDCCPPLDTIKVLRAGLNLGTFLKNRFEPSHSLALSLKAEDVKNYVNLSINDELIYKYFSGETFECDGNKGWNLILVEGISAGFGKLTNNIMKNHYPKGLRKSLY